MKSQAVNGTAFELKLEKDGVVPIYVQLANAIGQRIASGALHVGDRLESEAALCKQFEISRVTARLAVDELVKQGLVERKQGKGTYVSGPSVRHEPADLNQFFDAIFARGLRPMSKLLAFIPQHPPEKLLRRFGLPDTAELMRMDRLYSLENQILGFSEGWMPLAASRFSIDVAENRSSASLLADIGLSATETQVSIKAGAATKGAAAHLVVPHRSPVLFIERDRFLADGTLIESVHFTMNPALYEFSFRSKTAIA